MKLLYINIAFEGHHLDYLKALASMDNIESHVILEKYIPDLECEQHIITDTKFGSNNLIEHLKWCLKVKKVVREVAPDIIHLVWGDSFYRFFGLGFAWIKKHKSVITFHQVRKTKLHQLSIRILSKIFSKIVVHTESLYMELKSFGINNIKKITYPNLRKLEFLDKNEALTYLGISSNKPVLLALGGTRKDKGLDILLEALDSVKEPFHLLVAGAEQNIKREYIIKASSSYTEDTTILLKYLSEYELKACYSACDYIVLPYRKIFDGASGPLAEGVAYGKTIIGPSHGSIGQIIKDNHLGKCFETEDVNSLVKTIDSILEVGFEYDEIAKQYQNSLKVTVFQENHKALYADLME